MPNTDDKVFPDEKNECGIDLLTYMATHIAAGYRAVKHNNGLPHIGASKTEIWSAEQIAKSSVRDALALIKEINKHYEHG
jgi:hypothetical protein